MTNEINIVNVSKQSLLSMGYKDFQEWANDPNNLYIGRDMSRFIKGCVGSKWANPFPVQKYGRDGCIRAYREYFLKSDLMNQLDELKGKNLGCWCYPQNCHGDVLKEIFQSVYSKKLEVEPISQPISQNIIANDDFPPLQKVTIKKVSSKKK
jgi:hypothetical protein